MIETPPPTVPDAVLDRLLRDARTFEAQGRLDDALDALREVATARAAQGKVDQYVYDWMAQLFHALGEPDFAERAVRVGRRRAEEAGHVPGMFRMDVRLARFAADDHDLARAAALLASLRDDRGTPPPIDPARGDDTAAWLETLRFARHPRLRKTPLQIEAAAAIAKLWAEQGKYRAALALLSRVAPLVALADDTIDGAQLQLLQAELALSAGQLDDAGTRLAAVAPGLGRVPRAIMAARIALTRGQLAQALGALDDLAAAPAGVPGRFVAAALARLAILLELNLHEEARRVIDHAIATLTAAGAGPRVLAPLLLAQRDAERRRTTPLLDWEQAHAVGSASLRPSPPPPDAVPGSFAATWTATASQVRAALADQDLDAAEAAQRRLAQLSRGAESALIDARLALSAGLIAYYRRTASTAALLDAAGRLRALGVRLEEAQALRFASWNEARAGRIDRYAQLSRQSSDVIDAVAGELDAEHRALFLLDKWDGRDELVSVMMRRLLSDRRGQRRTPSRRATCHAFRQIEQLTHWPVDDALGDAHARGLAPDAHPDRALAWVREGLDSARKRAGAPDEVSLRWWPNLWRFPRDTLALHYHVLPDRTYLFRIARGRIDARLIPLGRANLAGLVPGLARGDAAVMAWMADALGVAEAWRDFRGIQRLVVIPHQAIANVPFAALQVNDQPLCAQVAIAQVDRLSRLHRRPLPRTPPPHRAPGSFVGAYRASYVGSRLRNLPGARAEVRGVHATTAAGTLLPDATRPQVLAALPRATWFHVAAHGVFDAAAPERSGIVLGDGADDGDNRAGYATLTLQELRRLDLRGLALATLATCRSAEHADLPGRERICLPTALLDAGARGVIGSLWPIDDALSVEVMAALYRHLAERSPAIALARTQAELAARGVPALHWAGLVYYGDG